MGVQTSGLDQRLQMDLDEWKTSVKCVQSVYSWPGLFKIAIYYSYSYYQYCPTIKLDIFFSLKQFFFFYANIYTREALDTKVYKLLVWTKGFKWTWLNGKQVWSVQSVYSWPGLFKIAIYYSYSYYQYCPTIKVDKLHWHVLKALNGCTNFWFGPKASNGPGWMENKCEVCTVSVQLTRSVQNSYIL